MSTFAARQSNLALAPARDIRWASWSLMDARLEGIERLLAMGRPWDLLINLSGQCFPLRTQPQIRAALDDQPGRNFVETFDPLTTWVDPYARVRRIRIEVPFRSTGYNLPRDARVRVIGRTKTGRLGMDGTAIVRMLAEGAAGSWPISTGA